ncbi:DUF2335 domain-containing protein [Serratia microhaemolytica]|uniref:DUF2335 domain-containing protein n=1 Tax=Serratia microhaemolytica TaxID=2675110 RepID=UPI000FDE60C9|nr:DUF2335 domain-containing protein [Serratia microhaemolytica]
MSRRKHDTVAKTKQRPSKQAPVTRTEAVHEAVDGTAALLMQDASSDPELIERITESPDGVGVMMKVSRMRTGPLPDAEELARYERVTPGLAKEIVGMAKSEQNHRHEMTRRALEGAISKDKRGQILAFACVLVLSGVSLAMVASGAYWPATTVLGTTLVALVSVFHFGRRRQTQTSESEEKHK